MGAAWRGPKDRDLEKVAVFIGSESAGARNLRHPRHAQARPGRAAARSGLDYYNHNLDTSPQFYGKIISTRTRPAGDARARARRRHPVCCGGIVGMGELREDRAALIAQLASLEPHPESVPINSLVAVEGTPLAHVKKIDPLEFVRAPAVARICMPKAWVRLSAGAKACPRRCRRCASSPERTPCSMGRGSSTPNPETLKDRALRAPGP